MQHSRDRPNQTKPNLNPTRSLYSVYAPCSCCHPTPPLPPRRPRAPSVMAAALEVSPPASPQPAKHAANEIQTHSCPSCGHSLNTSELEEARRKIEELEAQMERLKEKATAAGTRPRMRHQAHQTIKPTQTNRHQSTNVPITRTKSAASKLASAFPAPCAHKPRHPMAPTTQLHRFLPLTLIPHGPAPQTRQRLPVFLSSPAASPLQATRALCPRLHHQKTTKCCFTNSSVSGPCAPKPKHVYRRSIPRLRS